MEVTGTLEFSGIERLVIDRKEVWQRNSTPKSGFVWMRLTGSHRKNRPHEKIIRAIRGYVASPRHRVWVHGDTVNVERRERKKIQLLYDGHIIAEPEGIRVILGRGR